MITEGFVFWFVVVGTVIASRWRRSHRDGNTCPLCSSRDTAFHGNIGWRRCNDCGKNFQTGEA